MFRISDRKFARLGEYDTRTEEDGVHVDVRIAQTKIHGHYDKKIFFNDIAMIYLAEDVEFNGMCIVHTLHISTYKKFNN